MLDLTSWEGFRKTFEMPVLISLLGAVTGHYGKTNSIQLFTIGFPYKKGTYLKDSKGFKKVFRWIYILVELAFHTFGFRFGSNRLEGAIWIYPGFLGDMLVGVGTGILAKTALSLSSPDPNDYAVISASFLAGFAGLSFIRSQQAKGLNNDAKNLASALDAAGEELDGNDPETQEDPAKKHSQDQIRESLQQAAAGWSLKTTSERKKKE